jgi:hypothetical protein
VLVFSLLFIIQFFFLFVCVGGSLCTGAYAGWMSPTPAWSGVWCTGAPLFPQCNMAWRNFPWSRGSGCWNFDSSCALFPLSVALAYQQGFWFTELTLSASVL